ncbi:hypothetical protein K1T71_013188 [Dendrolimus kikuchii]|uniref:Uncharacterized protein n=1 Tax=Dendrolimus kikuchii TaxID=765133 RepID=A0ACC1CJ84_9NEOP|nr:hypothetical protein K1T71_013188 [Dendrolimus kikuchii]
MCRVCLRKDVKLYHYNGFQLKWFYEEMMHLKIVDEDKLPRYFCFECAAMLHKFHKFKVKCHRGLEILLDILNDKRMSQESIIELDIRNKEVHSGLDIMRVNERVKTITVKKRTELKHTKGLIEIIDNFKTEEGNATETSIDEDVCKSKTSILQDVLFDDDSMDYDEKKSDCIINDNFEGDNKIIIEDDNNKSSSSDDDTLSNLKNKTLNSLKKTETEDAPKMVTVKTSVKNTAKKKRVRAKKGEKAMQERKRPKLVLQSEYWERRQLSEEEAWQEFERRAASPKYAAAAHRCAHCYKGFSQEDMLLRHNNKKHAESLGPVVCKFCRCRFRIQCRLRRHLHQHYNLYKCLRCNLVCNLELSALLHEEHHNGVVKKCDHCGEEFTHTSTYYSHLRSHRSAFVCTLCGQSFVSAMGLRYHKTLKHAHLDAAPSSQAAKSGDGDEDTYCARCEIRFETREAFEQHYLHSAMHSHGNAAQECADRWRDKALTRRPRAPTLCPHCNTTFRTKSGFLKHPCMRTKAEAEGGARGRGRGRGRARGWVQMHPERRPQPNAKKEMCEICGATVGALYMPAHLNTHTHQKAYACDVCGATTYSQSSHKRHQLTHTGERPYPCPLCEKRFTQSNSMKLHYRTFHLKEPYPKRNRKMKDDASLAEFSALQTWSADS